MSDRNTSDQAVPHGASPGADSNASQPSSRPPSSLSGDEGSSEGDPARERERALIEAFREDAGETGEFLSPMYSTTSNPLAVSYDWELFDPPLTVKWSAADEDGGEDDLSDFVMTASMPRLLNVKTFDDDGEDDKETRYLYDSLASAIVLAFHDYAAKEYVHTADNLKHRIFFAMQQLETETGFTPHKVQDYVEDRGGSKFDDYGLWSIKVGREELGGISQTIVFDLEKPIGWNPLKVDDTVLLDLIIGANPGESASGSQGNEIVLVDGLDEIFPSEPGLL